MDQRPNVKEFVVRREITPAYDEAVERGNVMNEFVQAVAEHFGFWKTKGNEEEGINPTIALKVVCMTQEQYEEYQDLEERVRDLEQELDRLTDESVIEDE